MIGVYEYDTATKEECINCLKDIIGDLYGFTNVFLFELSALEKKGIRIQNIANRLKELGERDD
jgi:hypothetical protein